MPVTLVLLITDDEALTELVKLLLNELNVTVMSTNDPNKAIRRLSHIRASLLLVDTSAPNALEAIKQLKANPLTCTIPLIGLCYATSFDPKEESKSALAVGADDVVLKESMAG